jgi:AcrR family transcriptional regulator
MTGKDDVRGRILDAAHKRFMHYGYAKTTMAEIAADLSMSPGNLYRYFPGKIDIALAISEIGLDEEYAALVKVAEDKTVPVLRRLRDFFHLDMVHTYRQIDKEPRVFEMAQVIKTERPHWINGWLSRQRTLITALLAEGQAEGLFDIADFSETAEMLQTALMKFRYPQLWSALKLPALEREFDGVTRLLLTGLAGEKGSARDCDAAFVNLRRSAA